MEEDIKILEDVLKDKDTMLWIGEQGIQAIQNLIERNKELEEEIQKDKMKIDFLVGKKIEEIAKHGKEVEIKMNAIYVPKDKIKEIIENSYPDIAVQKLYELLEEGRRK